MLYLDYAAFRRQYIESQRAYDRVLREKEAMFARTQPQAVDFGRERVGGGPQGNVFEAYVLEKERTQIDARLAEAKAILDDRADLLRLKEQDLRKSRDIYDRLYCMYWLDRQRVRRIARMTTYSEPSVYRLLRQIRDALREVDKF